MIRNRSRRTVLPARPWRLLSLGLSWLVLALSLAGVSPDTHALIHASEAHASCADSDAPAAPVPSDDHVCAVVLFAHGVELPVTDRFARPPEFWREIVPLTRPEIFLMAPRYLRQPERGPPLA